MKTLIAITVLTVSSLLAEENLEDLEEKFRLPYEGIVVPQLDLKKEKDLKDKPEKPAAISFRFAEDERSDKYKSYTTKYKEKYNEIYGKPST